MLQNCPFLPLATLMVTVEPPKMVTFSHLLIRHQCLFLFVISFVDSVLNFVTLMILFVVFWLILCYNVIGKLGIEYFASISSSSGKQTLSVGVNPQPVSPPPTQM